MNNASKITAQRKTSRSLLQGLECSKIAKLQIVFGFIGFNVVRTAYLALTSASNASKITAQHIILT